MIGATNFTRWFVVVAVAGGLAGCATPGPILTQNVAAIRIGIAKADDHTSASFDAANNFVRAQAVERKAALPEMTLAEADFPQAIATKDAAAWAMAFDALDRYADALQRLVDPRLAQGTGDALTEIGTELQSGAIKAKLPGPVVGLFATLGQAIVTARAEKKATDIMRRVDPAFGAVVTGMAGAVGADDRSGLRGTMHAGFENELGKIRGAYALLPTANIAARRKVATQFIETLDARDAESAALDRLRTALLALGQAHAAAARGDNGDALFWIGRIDGWLDAVQRRAAKVDAAKD